MPLRDVGRIGAQTLVHPGRRQDQVDVHLSQPGIGGLAEHGDGARQVGCLADLGAVALRLGQPDPQQHGSDRKRRDAVDLVLLHGHGAVGDGVHGLRVDVAGEGGPVPRWRSSC